MVRSKVTVSPTAQEAQSQKTAAKPTETEKLRETPFTLSEAIAGVDVVYCDSWMSRMLRGNNNL